jgi:hypothetical protein
MAGRSVEPGSVLGAEVSPGISALVRTDRPIDRSMNIDIDFSDRLVPTLPRGNTRLARSACPQFHCAVSVQPPQSFDFGVLTHERVNEDQRPASFPSCGPL